MANSASRPGLLGWLMFIPLTLWLLVLVAAPTVMLVVYSFCDRDDDLGTPIYQFTWANYQAIFDPGIWPVLRRAGLWAAVTAAALCAVTAAVHRRFSIAALRWGLLLGGAVYLHFAVKSLGDDEGAYLGIFVYSAEMAGLTTLLCLLIGYPTAFFIARSRPRLRGQLLMAVMIPFWISFVIRTYAWMNILSESGLLNGFMHAARMPWLIPASGAVLYTPTAAVIGLVYAYLPFMILPIFGSIEKLDDSLIEASMDLGAGPVRTIIRVILPLTAPGVAAGILLVFVPAIGMFAVSDLMSGNKLPMIGSVIEKQFGEANNQPMGAAMGVTLLLMFGLVFLVTGFKKPAGLGAA